MTTPKARKDSDSDHSPIDDKETLGEKQGELETLGHGQLPPDPDAHLSPEERAAIVCSIRPQSLCSNGLNSSNRIANSSGNSTCAW